MVPNMKHLYGTFSNEQILDIANTMHNSIHRLLLYKDKYVKGKGFTSDEEFKNYFLDVLFIFGGLNTLLGEPKYMVILLATLQAAYNELDNPRFRYWIYRKAILDSHGYIKAMLEEVENNAEPINS